MASEDLKIRKLSEFPSLIFANDTRYTWIIHMHLDTPKPKKDDIEGAESCLKTTLRFNRINHYPTPCMYAQTSYNTIIH